MILATQKYNLPIMAFSDRWIPMADTHDRD
jgi:hypothetical protein